MSAQTDWVDTPSAISSPESPAGRSPSSSPAGQQTDLFGQDHAPASRSRPPAKAKASTMNGTSGRSSTASSASADLSRSMASKLAVRLASTGSTMYRMTWNPTTTPSGRSHFRLAASVRRTSDSDYIGWPTPVVGNATGGQIAKDISSTGKTPGGGKRQVSLNQVAKWATWPTPIVNDAAGSQYSYGSGDKSKKALKLPGAAQLAAWPTPAAQEAGGTPEQFLERKRRAQAAGASLGVSLTSLNLMAQTTGRVRLTATGALLTGSGAETTNGGPLNPALSRWLMGFPPGWHSSKATETP